MESKPLQVKHHGWHNVILTDDLMTGDTFAVRDWIKKALLGRWSAERKGWIVDLDAVARHTTDAGTLMSK